MTDIVKRLRAEFIEQANRNGEEDAADRAQLASDAGAEIERLRGLLREILERDDLPNDLADRVTAALGATDQPAVARCTCHDADCPVHDATDPTSADRKEA